MTDKTEEEFEKEMADIGMACLGIVHEIKNPVTLIHGYGETLKEGSVKPEKMGKVGEKIEKSALKILDIITNVRALINNEHTTNEPVQVATILEEVKNSLDKKIKSQKVTISIESDLTITGNKTRLYQVFYNLVNNAIDAISTNYEKWIKISCLENEKIVKIQDSGKIDPEIAKKVFLPLFSTKFESGKGTGVGLYLVKRILESNKANISIDSTAPHTTFILKF